MFGFSSFCTVSEIFGWIEERAANIDYGNFNVRNYSEEQDVEFDANCGIDNDVD